MIALIVGQDRVEVSGPCVVIGIEDLQGACPDITPAEAETVMVRILDRVCNRAMAALEHEASRTLADIRAGR